MRDQRVERFGHVPVAHVPRVDPAAKHRTVILLRILDEPRVLLGIEELVARNAPVAVGEFRGATPQLNQLLDDGRLARLGRVVGGSVRVRGRVLAEVLEARITMARPARGLGVNLIQVPQYGLNRSVEPAEVEPVEANLCRADRQRVVVYSQPLGELAHDRVAPHPDGETLEARECRARYG